MVVLKRVYKTTIISVLLTSDVLLCNILFDIDRTWGIPSANDVFHGDGKQKNIKITYPWRENFCIVHAVLTEDDH